MDASTDFIVSSSGSGWLRPMGGGPLFFAFSLFPLALLLCLWLLLARSGFVNGDDMERPSRVGQLYGYTVCLVAVIVFLVSTNSLVENAFTLSNPLEARESDFGPWEPSLTSFESYRATIDRERRIAAVNGQMAPRDTTPEPALRTRYEALRADRIARMRFHAQRDIASSALSLLLAIALFAIHWRWLRRRE
ncbi:MAG TPA: hypothetical protein VHM30_09460, partial [Gemmatimonadaceae bacterium]|nr:hypothetical protein [Gemmatimonadaceae bacterium]